ncbi:hypothetical protein [Geoglobus ahangari]
MPKLITKLERNVEKIHPSVTPGTVDRINELLATEDFKGLSDLIRRAIDCLYREYEAKGKLKPKRPPETAEERIKNAVFAGSKEVEIE